MAKDVHDFKFRYGTLVQKEGFAQIPNLLIRHRKALKLSAAEQYLAIYLLSFDHDGLGCSPSLERMGKITGMSSSTIHNAKKGLVAKGYITVFPAKHKKQPNSYRLDGLRKALRALAVRRLKDRFLKGRVSEQEMNEWLRKDTGEDAFF